MRSKFLELVNRLQKLSVICIIFIKNQKMEETRFWPNQTCQIYWYKIHNKFFENCYWVVIGRTVQRFKTWLLELRTGLYLLDQDLSGFKCQIGVASVHLFGKETLETKPNPIRWYPEQNDQMVQ